MIRKSTRGVFYGYKLMCSIIDEVPAFCDKCQVEDTKIVKPREIMIAVKYTDK